MTNNNNLHLWRWRIALIGLLIIALMTWGLASVYHSSKQRQRHHAERELQVISQLQGASLRAWREQRLTDAAVLSDNVLLGQAVAAWLALEGTDRASALALADTQTDAGQGEPAGQLPEKNSDYGTLQAQLESELRIQQEQNNYSAVYLLDLNGQVRLASNGVSNRRLPQAEVTALREAFRQAQPTVVEPRRDIAFAFPFFSLLVPVYDDIEVVGAVWLVMDVRASLYPLLERWPSGSATAESAIMIRDGDDVLILSPLRHHHDEALPYRIPLSRTSDPAVQTVLGMRGIFYSRDYRNEPVIAVANIVPGSPWYLLSKVDTQEAFANEWRELLTLGLPVFIALLCGGTILVYLQRQAWLRERELKVQLERTLRWLENAQQTAAVGYFAYNLGTKVFSVSPTTRAIFGLLADIPMSLERWLGGVHPLDRKKVTDAYRRVVSQRSPLHIQHRIQRESDHQERWVETWGEYEADTRSRGGIRLIGTIQDITERKLIEAELEKAKTALEEQVRLDALTQIANRLALDERLAEEWRRALRYQQPLSLLMIDVDHFKHFNDHYGHVAGDQCLQRVVRVISSVVMRSVDLVARYGGEEFVVLLPETDDSQASRLAERICAAIRLEAIEHKHLASSGIVTVSIGVVCVYPGPDQAVEAGIRALLERADAALYVAKNSGRGRVVMHDASMSHNLTADMPASAPSA